MGVGDQTHSLTRPALALLAIASAAVGASLGRRLAFLITLWLAIFLFVGFPDLSYVAFLAVRLRADARLLPLNTGR
jgi:hypothetical protein